uniref:Uncharacterized protein n=1 Tax=Arion vulgaris TaxID=1028688 RepID=A0A0B7ADQ9_9EUPU
MFLVVLLCTHHKFLVQAGLESQNFHSTSLKQHVINFDITTTTTNLIMNILKPG